MVLLSCFVHFGSRRFSTIDGRRTGNETLLLVCQGKKNEIALLFANTKQE